MITKKMLKYVDNELTMGGGVLNLSQKINSIIYKEIRHIKLVY